MILSDAFKLRGFKYVAEFGRKKPAWKLTGKYFYDDGISEKHNPKKLTVEIQLSKIFIWQKTWILLSDIIPIYKHGKHDLLPEHDDVMNALKS